MLMNFLRSKPIRRTIITVLLVIFFFELIIFVSEGFRVQAKEKELLRQSYAIETEVEKVFSSVYIVSEAYISFIKDDTNISLDENEAFLYHLMQQKDIFVRNIAYVEDTTIKYNYPYDENSDSIGVDLSLVDGQKDDVLLVKNQSESILIGPVELVQGGQAFILRKPIIIDTDYHGQIATVIDANELYTLLQAKVDTYDISIIIRDQNGNHIVSRGEVFNQESVTTEFEDDYLHWSIQVFTQTNGVSEAIMRHIIRLIGLIAALIVSGFVYRNGKLHEAVYFKATHDSLTNDFNRTKFVEDFNDGKYVGNLIAFTDINKFKILNDTLGHHFGDWGLVNVSKKFNRSGMFTTYRNSGDEFIIVTKEPMKEEEFLKYVDDFNTSIYNEQLNQNISITLSIGVIEELAEDLELETMLMYLDYAMYDAKKAGKTYTLVDEDLMIKYTDQKIVEDTIINDINNNKLRTYFQPIINVRTRKIEGIEALSRWVRNGKIVPAAMFINTVKKIKYVEKLDQNLFDNIQHEYQKLKEEDFDISDMYFAINLSAETLKIFENDFLEFDDFVKNRIIPKEQIVFEISEDINLGVISAVTLDYIRNQGYALTIDDFGSGVSKLTDVLSGQIQAIKTDKSMVPADLNEKKKVLAFNTIIKAINASGSKVCAEGVETKEQLQITLDANVCSVQGYLFSKPISYTDLVEYIKNYKYSNYL